MRQDHYLPDGVTPQMIDRHYGYDVPDLAFYIKSVNILEYEIEVDVEWHVDGKSHMPGGCADDYETVSGYYDLDTSFSLPMSCKDMDDDELYDYIIQHINP